jgi:hypothetical protein
MPNDRRHIHGMSKAADSTNASVQNAKVLRCDPAGGNAGDPAATERHLRAQPCAT